MLQETKTFIIKCSIVFGVIFVGGMTTLGVMSCRDARIERAKIVAEKKKAEDHKFAQYCIQDMIAICDFRKMSDEEFSQIQKCGDDIDAVKNVLLNTIQDRIAYWANEKSDCISRFEKLNEVRTQSINNGSYYASVAQTYAEVKENLSKSYQLAETQHKNFSAVKVRLSEWTELAAKSRQNTTTKKGDA